MKINTNLFKNVMLAVCAVANMAFVISINAMMKIPNMRIGEVTNYTDQTFNIFEVTRNNWGVKQEAPIAHVSPGNPDNPKAEKLKVSLPITTKEWGAAFVVRSVENSNYILSINIGLQNSSSELNIWLLQQNTKTKAVKKLEEALLDLSTIQGDKKWVYIDLKIKGNELEKSTIEVTGATTE